MACSSGAGFAALAIAASLTIGGCGDDGDMPPSDSGMADTSVVDSGTPDTSSVDLPDPPMPPVLTPCPAGWAEIDLGDGSPITCDPYPAPPVAPCGRGEAHFVGEPGCAPIGPPCPVDGWPTDLPSDRPILYVSALAGPGGDGTLAAPYTAITDAIAASPPSAVIAVAPGTYTGSLVLDTVGLSIAGACMDVIIEGSMRNPVINMRSSTAELSNLTLIGGREGLIAWESTVQLRSIEIAPGATELLQAAVWGRASTITADSLVLRGPMNDGLIATTDASIELRRALIDGAMQSGVSLTNSSMSAESTALRDYGLADATGSAIFSHGVSELTLSSSAIENGLGEPVLTADESQITIVDSTIVGPPLDADAPLGGTAVIGPGSLTLERVSISRLRGGGIIVAVGARLDARDVVVRDTVSATTGNAGHGIEVADGATASLERVLVDRATAVAFLVDGRETVVDATDLVVTATHGDRVGTFGRAIQVQSGGVMTLLRAELRDNREAAVVVSRLRSLLTAEHLHVTGTQQRRCAEEGGTCAAAGIGIGVYEQGAANVERVHISDSFITGIQIASDGSLDLANGVVENNPVGANVQVDGYDLSRLTANVIYRDNGVNLDAQELPVPDPDAVRR